MPFSSDGDTIDFIYGVINWKDLGEGFEPPPVISAELPPLEPQMDELEDDDVLELSSADALEPGEDDTLAQLVPAQPEPEFQGSDEVPGADAVPFAVPHLSWEDGPLADPHPGPELELEPEPLAEADEEEAPAIELDADAGLADRLWAARESAEVCKQADGRSRVALYRALAMAYDFAVATKRVPEEYSEILEDAGVKSQARAPMTPIVKLVFGVEYDKTRLTEFAAALSYAERQRVDFGGFQQFVEEADGGLKGLVAEERKARRPGKPAEDKVEAGKHALRAAPSIPLAQLPTNQEFALVLTRRNADGIHEVVDVVADSSMLERALRRAAS
jgi:hypothetical protein